MRNRRGVQFTELESAQSLMAVQSAIEHEINPFLVKLEDGS